MGHFLPLDMKRNVGDGESLHLSASGSTPTPLTPNPFPQQHVFIINQTRSDVKNGGG